MERFFCNGTGQGTSTVRYLNLPTKRFMCNVRPSMKILGTVPGVHIVYRLFLSNHYSLLICRYNCIMMSQVTGMANSDVITIAYTC